MDVYDFVIAGAGAAGLSLAHRLIHSPLRDRSILVIDKDDADQLNRNWGFWTNQRDEYTPLAHRTWDRLRFASDGIDRLLDLEDYRYHLIRGADFYRYSLKELALCDSVTFVHGAVDRIEDGEDTARVVIDDQAYAGRWVFDSLFRPGDLPRESPQFRYLKMHFKGWEIETDEPAFDPEVATLFDFRTPQDGAMRFFYVLPSSGRQALVEYTIFSANVLAQDEYESALRDYIAGVLGIRAYRVADEENGVVPITDHPFARRAGKRIMAIGTKGGRVKPSSGYSFRRVQQDAAAIVDSLIRLGHPFDVPEDHVWYRLTDSILLEIMHCRGDQLKPIFNAMFQRNPARRIFRFLDHSAGAGEQARLIASLPPGPFVAALGRMALHALRLRR